MHRLAATPGGWNPDAEGVIFIEQTPAPIVLLTAADTDIQTLAAAVSKLPEGFPALRVVNLLQLQQQLSIDTYAEEVLEQAQVIILRLLGGRSYWSYGLEVVRETVQRTGAALIVMPGDDRPDPDLISHSTVSLSVVNQLWRYLIEGGGENFANALKFIADICLEGSYNPLPPQEVPRVGLYQWEMGDEEENKKNLTPQPPSLPGQGENCSSLLAGEGLKPKVGILFYRAHYLAGNTAVIDALCQALAARKLEPVPVFVSSLRDPDVQEEVLQQLQPKDAEPIQVLLSTTSFAISSLPNPNGQKLAMSDEPLALSTLDVPVLQVILSGGTVEQWESGFQGLSPRDMAMNVALPEVDGRIISRAVSFKAVQTRNPQLETDVVVYEPVRDRVEFVADLASNWAKLRQTPPSERRIALILANYPNRDGRLANGVGLDTPASCVEILKALQLAGYQVEDIPATGDELIGRLTAGVTNDPEGRSRPVGQFVAGEEYQEYFATLPVGVQKGICDRWSSVLEMNRKDAKSAKEEREERQEKEEREEKEERFIDLTGSVFQFPIPGIYLGNVFVGIQPARGYDIDPSLNYHAPDLEPPHRYLAFYYWVRQHFEADAIVHVGKHGNLEWLPGKSVALCENCYPEVALGALPHLYPFIVNDPGEGSQAKRRAQAVIIDHLTPPMTRAELYGSLQQLEGLIDEYYEAQSLDPSRLPVISDRITQLVLEENLHQDLGLETLNNRSEEIQNFLTRADGYLCELKEAQIRDGLHIFGQCPQGRQLRDLIVAIARHPGTHRLGLTRAIAQNRGLDFDPLTADPAQPLSNSTPVEARFITSPNKSSCIVGDVIEALEQEAANLVEQLIMQEEPLSTQHPALSAILEWIHNSLLPSLQQTTQEITNLLRGLDGRFVPSGASGAPTRGRPDVLPTGRNFYSVDIRAIPTETAWLVGRKAAEVLIERYTQENGEYPKTLGLSVWGTSTMRTGGDDLAEALALLGVQPVWDSPSRRVVDFEILPISVLNRPRVDVTLRISGFFRDAFPNLIDLFDQAVAAVAALDEPPEQNPLAAQVKQETELWAAAGLNQEQAEMRSRYRIFGSKPGAYGAGLQGLIEAQNWTDDQDLARAYINWSSYAYTSTADSPPTLKRGAQKDISSPPLNKGGLGGISAPEAFEQRLRQMQIVLHNQDNREHDLLDSDDYYQFQGGLTAAVRAMSGKNPQTYFGDNSFPENPKVRQLREEIARVYRSRVVNPKWIAGVMRHGYKGAFEMAATVDYLFAYDATANCVEDFMYQGVAEAYLFDQSVQDFIQQKNPWALRDMAERLLEANQRGLWKNIEQEMVDKLRSLVHQAEAVIENMTPI
ncbi:cobaltochelatase subunit CobN [Coleofasciculus sp. FACHB-1120]|uniref:cobaltochelatase subunit CobN n=1 Tax=Coleofasciculus sp. FACHB-1120 TaxID=2692783 RepID=UPI001681F1E4|nr:cobaltochelatase subunit CobN [Coleofasciculus sp. FACHB-1120]MBD2742497.1 cobaltochelatase subunit CobN [Coleofasciculus sp. FACHB-1120]